MKMKKIDFANLKIQHKLYKEEIEEAILKVARDCNFIMGSQIDELTGSKYLAQVEQIYNQMMKLLQLPLQQQKQ